MANQGKDVTYVCDAPWIRDRQLWGGPTIPKLGDPRVNVEPG
ncbi:MAG TPA: hypothetical protein VGL34_16750 [Steroidobacteraceae bacterium]|jgi:hypothetical protein